jgi:DNA-binding CsgD family transcriptional regulator
VRSQLKQVLAKTGLGRQAELVSLLAGASTVR